MIEPVRSLGRESDPLFLEPQVARATSELLRARVAASQLFNDLMPPIAMRAVRRR